MSESMNERAVVAIVLNRDLLFGSRIRSVLANLVLQSRFVPNTEQFIDALRELNSSAALGIIDMNGTVSWDLLGEALSKEGDLAPTLAFGPHVDVESRRAAKIAGVTRIVSNGQFQSDMAGLIDRYRRR